ncbi:translesion DNA synthesis-associated protein ImuA [Piscinibacter sp. HJYY11]|uniref:translesion DNA synthesis-associated protein ImuA n=1 Tax=Piscinibacter sp. HJYY11 TaxID=2801333 RepID=UPI00191EF639|nr:translesion DNA synthesis-associated protein ImuA [Piscinibacter sp. HJYY11]MBL0730721.1 translesion DNA synthesis-associated protein ImuA [Piscinibacter sp. HJYY11]
MATAQLFAPNAPLTPVPRAQARPALAPEDLHPQLWRAHQLGRSAERPIPSGFEPLDAELPGGGWPCRALTELLLPQAGIGEIRLLAACLARVQQAGRLVMMFDPPAAVSAPGLSEMGLDVAQLLVIQTHLQVHAGADRLWALEQALKSGHVGAVVAWMPPRLRAERVRRLQLAAHVHDGPAFIFREPAVQGQASAAPLRLALHPAGPDQLALRVLKRRGPPLLAPLHLALPPVLTAAAARRAELGQDEGALAGLSAATFINLV